MKHGASISGLNIAATVWATAAIGTLAGSGLWQLAVIGTAAIVITNTLLRPIGRLMDKQPGTTLREPASASYVFRETCHDAAEAHIRALVVQAVTRTEFRLSAASRNCPQAARGLPADGHLDGPPVVTNSPSCWPPLGRTL